MENIADRECIRYGNTQAYGMVEPERGSRCVSPVVTELKTARHPPVCLACGRPSNSVLTGAFPGLAGQGLPESLPLFDRLCFCSLTNDFHSKECAGCCGLLQI